MQKLVYDNETGFITVIHAAEQSAAEKEQISAGICAEMRMKEC